MSNLNDLLHTIRGAFDALWQIRPRGESVEVITPFPAGRDKYVSLFVTWRNDRLIVTDGGWLSEGTYSIGEGEPDMTTVFNRILDYFIADFDVLRTHGPNNRTIYFKTTPKTEYVPNLVFDMANFVSLVSSTALVPLREERETRNTFSRRATDFIRKRVDAARFETNAILTDRAPAAKFNAIVHTPARQAILINFVTGSTSSYMIQSYCKSNTMFDLLGQSGADERVKERIVVMDDKAKGFNRTELIPFFDMSRAKSQRPLMWPEEKHRLEQLVNCD